MSSSLSLSPPPLTTPSILVYTYTAGYRHDSIPTTKVVLAGLQTQYGLHFVFTEDIGMFRNDTLDAFDAVMFVSTTGEVLDDQGKSAFQSYLQSGGNFIGIHAASDGMNTTEFYVRELGASFDYHPEFQNATFLPLNTTHPSMLSIPSQWNYQEEVYYFRSDPRDVGSEVLMTVDEGSYSNPGNGSNGNFNQGTPHPIAWCQYTGSGSSPLLPKSPGAGRSFYSSLGHSNATWLDPIFQDHVIGGLLWVLEGGTTRAWRVDGLVGAPGNGTNGTTTSTSTAAMGSSTVASGSATSSGSAASASSSKSSDGDRWVSNTATTLGAALLAIGVAVIA